MGKRTKAIQGLFKTPLFSNIPSVVKMERPSLIFSQDRDTAVTLAKGLRQDLCNFTQPVFHGGTTAQHLPTKWWPSTPSRGAHRMEIIGVKYSWTHIAHFSLSQCDWSNCRNWWMVDVDNWELLHSSSISAFGGPNNHVDQIHLLSLTRMLFSWGVFIYTLSCSGPWVADKVFSQRWVRLLSL